ncbi:MAG: calcium-binding protein [Methyloceanibacter sp.]|uniref:calcium-binding protein n=1 Tax=Methyloceanibacter sp. TaxID=1965321 RepID=UPI003D6D048B
MPVADTDIFNTSTPGITYAQDNETWTVNPGVFISASGAEGVFSNKAGSTLINNGTIFSGEYVTAGAKFTGADSSITNNDGGVIAGLTGLHVQKATTIANHGEIRGYYFSGINFDKSAQFAVTNDGEIRGKTIGIFSFSDNGGTIENAGLIEGGTYGILAQPTAVSAIEVDNAADGTIKGDEAAIYAGLGVRIILDNEGTMAGDIVCDGNNTSDVVLNKGKIAGDVLLGFGSDLFNGTGGTSGKVFGGFGNDTLIGGSGNDILDGGPGSDSIRGGRGKDSLFGGSEADLFDFDSIKESVKGSNRDVIHDFERGIDDIDLRGIDAKKGVSSNNAFKFIGKQDFHDKKGELRYEDKGSKVIVQGDVNGDGKADFEILVKVGALSAGDFLL